MSSSRSSSISRIAEQLARDADNVCRHYLPAGQRSGGYWIVGDVRGNAGRSMFVRLSNRGGKPAGKWMDAASGEHGDLLDIIRESTGLSGFGETLDEARRFLSLPRPENSRQATLQSPASSGSPEAGRRLIAASRPIIGTLVETYLAYRGVDSLGGTSALRFHPRCYHRPDNGGQSQTWPAMIAAVTDLSGVLQGVHRTWLARDQRPDHSLLGKAPLATPRRAMGRLLGNAVRFGHAHDVLLAGEGIETVLSVRCITPALPAASALSAGHLGAMLLPEGLRRLYVARENDAESAAAFARLLDRGHAAGIDVVGLAPRLKDFNDDLRLLGRNEVRAVLAAQLEPEDATRFIDRSG